MRQRAKECKDASLGDNHRVCGGRSGDDSEAGRVFSVAVDTPVIKTEGGFTRSGATNGFSARLYVIFSFF